MQLYNIQWLVIFSVFAFDAVSVPGPPSSVYFPYVSEFSARIAWRDPREPNGVVVGYRVAYGLDFSPTSSDDSLPASRRDYQVTGLKAFRFYQFAVTARTQSGWGAEESVVVYTAYDRSESAHLE